MIIDPLATGARCTEAELERSRGSDKLPKRRRRRCRAYYLDYDEVSEEPVYNMVPPAGVPAELGFNAAGIGLIMHVGGRVRTGADYGLSADISEIPDEHPIYGSKLTLWGPVGREPRPGTRPVRRRGSQTDLQTNRVFAAAAPWKGPTSRS